MIMCYTNKFALSRFAYLIHHYCPSWEPLMIGMLGLSPDILERSATKDNHTKTELCFHNWEYVKCLLNNEYVRQ